MGPTVRPSPRSYLTNPCCSDPTENQDFKGAGLAHFCRGDLANMGSLDQKQTSKASTKYSFLTRSKVKTYDPTCLLVMLVLRLVNPRRSKWCFNPNGFVCW